MTAATIAHTPEQIKSAAWLMRLSVNQDPASMQAASNLVKSRAGAPDAPTYKDALLAAHELEFFAGWTDDAITAQVDNLLDLSC